MIWMLSGMVLTSVMLTAAYPLAGNIEQVVLRRMARTQLASTQPCDLVMKADRQILKLQAELDVSEGSSFQVRRQLDRTEAWRKALMREAWNGDRPC